MSTTASNTILTNSINAITPTTGDIAIGASQTDGILNLGTGTGRTATGVINIGNTAGVNKISIQTASTLNSDADPAIAIGTAVSAKTIKIGHSGNATNSTVNVAGLSVTGRQFDVIVNPISNPSADSMYIANSQTSGGLFIGTGGGIVRSGNVNIATSNSNSCQINMMTGNSTAGSINMYTGNTTAGAVNIATGTGVTQSTVVNIGSGSTTGAITLGNTANTVQINGALTMGTGRNIILAPSTGYVAPSLSTQLGFVGYSANGTAGYVTTGMVTSASGNTPYMYGVATIQPGVYMFSVYFAPGVITFARVYIVTGTTKPADPSATGTGGTTQTTFGSVPPSNGGNCIIRLGTGSASGGEFTSFGIGIVTSARPNVGISIGIAGTGSFITGTYSFQFVRIA